MRHHGTDDAIYIQKEHVKVDPADIRTLTLTDNDTVTAVTPCIVHTSLSRLHSSSSAAA